jgi:hypothetical protein
MRDFAIRNELNGTGFALEAPWLSAPAPLPITKTLKTDFNMSDPERLSCARTPGSFVRFNLIERPKAPLGLIVEHRARSGKHLGFLTAINLMDRLVRILQALHARSVVLGGLDHGQVHIVTRNGTDTWVISRFESAFFADEFDLSPPNQPIGPLSSHWHIGREKPGYRDDLLRAVDLVAYAMYGPEYFGYLKSLSLEALNAFKAAGSVFTIAGLRPVTHSLGLSPEHTALVLGKLASVVAQVRSVPTPLSAPDYERILDEIRAITVLCSAAV